MSPTSFVLPPSTSSYVINLELIEQVISVKKIFLQHDLPHQDLKNIRSPEFHARAV